MTQVGMSYLRHGRHRTEGAALALFWTSCNHMASGWGT